MNSMENIEFESVDIAALTDEELADIVGGAALQGTNVKSF
ncbi:hypothetical protein GCM10010430_56240 [Kitasatospora cystarginea]|uniref:Lantibiotic n=1 Tax=Kitasatospora cystarginea TaxID=58350 RepID=A0ABN3END0_9ACTN